MEEKKPADEAKKPKPHDLGKVNIGLGVGSNVKAPTKEGKTND